MQAFTFTMTMAWWWWTVVRLLLIHTKCHSVQITEYWKSGMRSSAVSIRILFYNIGQLLFQLRNSKFLRRGKAVVYSCEYCNAEFKGTIEAIDGSWPGQYPSCPGEQVNICTVAVWLSTVQRRFRAQELPATVMFASLGRHSDRKCSRIRVAIDSSQKGGE